MRLFKNKLTATIIVLSFVFLGTIIYSAGKEDKGIVSSGVATVINPIQKIIYSVNDSIKDAVDYFLNFKTVKEENINLTKENIELENKLLEYETLKEENDRLREIVNFKNNKDSYNYIGTEIIGYSGESFASGYIVDKGENDGIKKDMIVISNEGLVGKVTSTGSNWSIIQSLINENIAVSVMVNTTRETSGILKGYTKSNDEYLTEVTNLSIDSKIKEGDVIVTSGLGKIYPKEIRVGEVISVETDEIKVMKTAIVKPYVDFTNLEELFIVAPQDTREIKYEE